MCKPGVKEALRQAYRAGYVRALSNKPCDDGWDAYWDRVSGDDADHKDTKKDNSRHDK